MNKAELKRAVRELKDGIRYHNDVDQMYDMMSPLEGLALSGFGKRKEVSHESVVTFLGYQCRMMNGQVDEEELSELCGLLRKKVVVV
jgi:hypothetical protein